MTSIAPAAAGGNHLSFGDVFAGGAGGVATVAGSGVAGAATGIFIGDKMWKGGIGAGLGLLGGGIFGGVVGLGAGVAVGGTITALRNGDRDLTKPGAIAGAIGGGATGAALALKGGDIKSILLFGGLGAAFGAVNGALVGSIVD
jgi:hypothetical protein